MLDEAEYEELLRINYSTHNKCVGCSRILANESQRDSAI